MSKEEKVLYVTDHLKGKGYRITGQRKLLLDIIFSGNYVSCKEIYFAAKRKDDSVGIATVYRTVQMLEDLGLVRKEMVLKLQDPEEKLSRIS